MLTLARKLKREEGMRTGRGPVGSNDASHRVSVRDRLLIKEVSELEANLPNTCKVTFPDANKLYSFQLAISPDEGYYQGGKFQFEIEVPEAYNMVPPKVKCLTRIWHPNIAETGKSASGCSMGIEFAVHCSSGGDFSDPSSASLKIFLNFDDPLNIDAAEHHLRDKDDFRSKVQDFIRSYAR